MRRAVDNALEYLFDPPFGWWAPGSLWLAVALWPLWARRAFALLLPISGPLWLAAGLAYILLVLLIWTLHNAACAFSIIGIGAFFVGAWPFFLFRYLWKGSP